MNLNLKNCKKINYKKRQRIRFIFLGFLISFLSLILIIYNFRDNIVFFYSPSELIVKINHIPDKKIIRVGGMVKKDNIINKAGYLEFTITDFKNDLRISYLGIEPNLFRANQGMVARGYFDHEKQIFIANELLAKHDENYMPPEIRKSLEKTNY